MGTRMERAPLSAHGFQYLIEKVLEQQTCKGERSAKDRDEQSYQSPEDPSLASHVG